MSDSYDIIGLIMQRVRAERWTSYEAMRQLGIASSSLAQALVAGRCSRMSRANLRKCCVALGLEVRAK